LAARFPDRAERDLPDLLDCVEYGEVVREDEQLRAAGDEVADVLRRRA